jgi:hypothetical protein
MVDATALEENNHRIPTVLGHPLEELLRAVTMPAAPAEAEAALVTVTVAAGAHHTVLAGELVAAVIARVEATQIATPPASHAVATMPAA